MKSIRHYINLIEGSDNSISEAMNRWHRELTRRICAELPQDLTSSHIVEAYDIIELLKFGNNEELLNHYLDLTDDDAEDIAVEVANYFYYKNGDDMD